MLEQSQKAQLRTVLSSTIARQETCANMIFGYSTVCRSQRKVLRGLANRLGHKIEVERSYLEFSATLAEARSDEHGDAA